MREVANQQGRGQDTPPAEACDELAQIRKDIERQIRSNQSFLARFLEDDFEEEQ